MRRRTGVMMIGLALCLGAAAPASRVATTGKMRVWTAKPDTVRVFGTGAFSVDHSAPTVHRDPVLVKTPAMLTFDARDGEVHVVGGGPGRYVRVEAVTVDAFKFMGAAIHVVLERGGRSIRTAE